MAPFTLLDRELRKSLLALEVSSVELLPLPLLLLPEFLAFAAATRASKDTALEAVHTSATWKTFLVSIYVEKCRTGKLTAPVARRVAKRMEVEKYILNDLSWL